MRDAWCCMTHAHQINSRKENNISTTKNKKKKIKIKKIIKNYANIYFLFSQELWSHKSVWQSSVHEADCQIIVIATNWRVITVLSNLYYTRVTNWHGVTYQPLQDDSS